MAGPVQLALRSTQRCHSCSLCPYCTHDMPNQHAKTSLAARMKLVDAAASRHKDAPTPPVSTWQAPGYLQPPLSGDSRGKAGQSTHRDQRLGQQSPGTACWCRRGGRWSGCPSCQRRLCPGRTGHPAMPLSASQCPCRHTEMGRSLTSCAAARPPRLVSKPGVSEWCYLPTGSRHSFHLTPGEPVLHHSAKTDKNMLCCFTSQPGSLASRACQTQLGSGHATCSTDTAQGLHVSVQLFLTISCY